MENEIERKEYIKKNYSKYWLTAREKIYGFSKYDKNLISLIENELKPEHKNFLEVAMGTGYPFSDYFANKGYDVTGVDIAPNLVEKCKKLNPKVNAIIGDAENLPFYSNSFDITFCFHSTWLFPNVSKSILEMIRVTKAGGLIFFDIQNSLNTLHIEAHKKRLQRKNSNLYKIIHIFKQIILFLLRKSNKISWKYIIYETPTNPFQIIDLIRMNEFQIYGRNNIDNLIIIKEEELYKFHRLVFVIKK